MSSAPLSLRLRRGVPVIARPPGLVQVGVDPHQRVLLPDTREITELLGLLSSRGAARPEQPDLVVVIDRLVRAGLVVDVAGRTALRRVRASRPVRIQGPDPWSGDLADLLTAANVRLCRSRDEAAVHVLVTAGEPDRDAADALVAEALPTLFVSIVDARVRVGPFVVPGMTACLRCLDAHAREHEAHVRALSPAVVPGRAQHHPLDQSPTAVTFALALATGDLVAWVEGRRPTSWSTSTWISDDLAQESRSWTRHPHCGCSWQDRLRTG